MRAEIDFHGGKSLLRKIVQQLGFRWKNSKSDRKVRVEKQSVVDQKLKYYARKKKLEQEGYNFVFIDETWIDTAYTVVYCCQSATTDGVAVLVSRGQHLIVVHGGSKEGFVREPY